MYLDEPNAVQWKYSYLVFNVPGWTECSTVEVQLSGLKCTVPGWTECGTVEVQLSGLKREEEWGSES